VASCTCPALLSNKRAVSGTQGSLAAACPWRMCACLGTFITFLFRCGCTALGPVCCVAVQPLRPSCAPLRRCWGGCFNHPSFGLCAFFELWLQNGPGADELLAVAGDVLSAPRTTIAPATLARLRALCEAAARLYRCVTELHHRELSYALLR
jgi:hypothetical protein